MAENSHYKTSDTTLACFLITEHFYLTSIDYQQVRYEYSFPSSKEIQGAANNYLSGSARTDPITFSRVNKKLMRVIRKRVQWEED